MNDHQHDRPRIDLHTPEHTARFRAAPVYEKIVEVSARDAVEGERITTYLADGHRETHSRPAEQGDKIITNPGGEEYLIGGTKFAARYRPTDREGIYRAVGRVRAFPNPTGKAVVIRAPWGEDMDGTHDCLFAAQLDESDHPTKDRYVIGRTEFRETYGLASTDAGRQLIEDCLRLSRKPMEPLTPEPDFRNHANQGSYTDEHKTYHLKHALDDALRLGIATDNAVDVDESES